MNDDQVDDPEQVPAVDTQPESSPHADLADPDLGVSEFGHDLGDLDVELLVVTLEAVTTERDSHLADLQRVSAEFANFRRQAARRQTETVEHAASGLAEKLLPVLDACEAAMGHGALDIAPIHGAMMDVLRKEGLEIVAESGVAFDPELHEAVMHVEGEGTEPTVVDIMRSGYLWNGRVVRPAMVSVRG